MIRTQHVIVDRDGVLNEEAPGHIVRSPDDWVWIEGALDALAMLHRHAIRVSVVTNQSAIGRGEVSASAVEALHAHVRAAAARAGGDLAAYFVCPHTASEGCLCRKPQPLLVRAAIEAASVPAEHTIFVGDMDRDLEAGLAAGVRVALVRSGKGRETEARLSAMVRNGPSFTGVFDDLRAVAARLSENAAR
ncbi:MAG: HAD-IIIA family hydrolase [Polyangiaceae bacterium]